MDLSAWVVGEFGDKFSRERMDCEALSFSFSLHLRTTSQRNFYTSRFLALFLAFAINFILLFYKVLVKRGLGGSSAHLGCGMGGSVPIGL